ncbi:MAG: NAD(P)/FAD-dependent oxidoreductase [Pseudomonadota bacterium]
MSFAVNRRQAILTMAAGFGAGALASAQSNTKAKIVIIGGGFGGASAARALRTLLPVADITLVEANATYTACPFSNLVLGTDRPMAAQQFSYAALSASGIAVIMARAQDIDPAARMVTLEDGSELSFDRLILSPGIDIRWGALEGYDPAATEHLPHAWKAGPQTLLLRQQLNALENGETVLMTVPEAPYRCPPGPYERASMIAHFLKTRKPRSKLIVLDRKDSFSKMALFKEAWAEHYPDHLEWRGAQDDGGIIRIDAKNREVFSDFGQESGAVINVIPPQKAGIIAERAGVTDTTGWCPIDAISFESTLQPNIHVIGDATIAAPMPKSAFSASLQAKICAIAVTNLLGGRTPEATILANTCYSYTAPDEAISIAGVYSNAGGTFSSIEKAGGVSPPAASKAVRADEATQAAHWFQTITDEAFA